MLPPRYLQKDLSSYSQSWLAFDDAGVVWESRSYQEPAARDQTLPQQ